MAHGPSLAGDKLRVLYIDGVGPFGGASRSLFEAVRAAKQIDVEPYFLATTGTSLDFYSRLAADLISTKGLSRFDNTRYSHYKGTRWAVLLREVYLLPFTASALFRARRRWSGFDIIHVNEILEIGPAIAAKKLFGAPLVVHVRSVQNSDPSSRRYAVISNLLRRHADAVIAIDETVRSSLPMDIAVDVIHNSFTPVSTVRDEKLSKFFEQLRPTSLKVGFVGNLHHSKGLFEMLEAARILKEERTDVEMIFVGGTTASDLGPRARALHKVGLAQNVRQRLAEMAANFDLKDSVHFFGATHDIKNVYDQLDVICFASHYDTPGRPIFEAAFSGVPSIAAITNPSPDTLVPFETGIAIPPRDATKLADAIRFFATNRDEAARMGRNAQRLAQANFDPTKNANKLVDVYRRIRS